MHCGFSRLISHLTMSGHCIREMEKCWHIYCGRNLDSIVLSSIYFKTFLEVSTVVIGWNNVDFFVLRQGIFYREFKEKMERIFLTDIATKNTKRVGRDGIEQFFFPLKLSFKNIIHLTDVIAPYRELRCESDNPNSLECDWHWDRNSVVGPELSLNPETNLKKHIGLQFPAVPTINNRKNWGMVQKCLKNEHHLWENGVHLSSRSPGLHLFCCLNILKWLIV